MIKKIIDEAKKARELSYSPYSNFKVGAAILMKDGKYIHGANIENVSYGLTNCAERNAMFRMILEGYKKEDAVAICVIGQTKQPISPCGACRQVMAELLPRDVKIILANMDDLYKETTLDELIPYLFEEIE